MLPGNATHKTHKFYSWPTMVKPMHEEDRLVIVACPAHMGRGVSEHEVDPEFLAMSMRQ